jgi:hypothetical protein
MIDQDWHNDGTRPFFSALQDVKVGDGKVSVAYGRLELPDGFVRDAIAGIGGNEDIAPTMTVHTEKLFELARQHQSLTFAQCMETAFASARQRSADSDPVVENRAAILALGYTLGHRHIKQFVGPDLPRIPTDLTRKFAAVSLRGRRDWTRHYALSAALEVFSNKLASHTLGVLKEELDADGGSGFSFGDVLADRAGTMLAVSAAESEESARAIQNRLADGFNIDDFMPDGADLPEGLQQEEFGRRYGGVHQARYNELIAEIDRRIGDCAAYQSPK